MEKEPEVAHQQQQKMAQCDGEPHVWTDNEIELLLNVLLEYKVNKKQRDAI